MTASFDWVVARMVELAMAPVAHRENGIKALEAELSTDEERLVMQAGLKALMVGERGVMVEDASALVDSEQVSLSEVVRGITSYLQTYVTMDSGGMRLVVYYILMTWFAPNFVVVPYLYVKSRGPGCGKTQLAYAIRNLSCRSVMTESISGAALAQLYEQHHGITIVLDEVDNWKPADKSEIFALFKASIRPGAGRIVLRPAGKSKALVPIQQDCYGPKVFVGIQREAALDPTLLSRCLIVEMREHQSMMPYVPPFDKDKKAAQLRRICAAVSKKYGVPQTFARHGALRQGMESLSSRQFDCIEPLLILASLADAEQGISQDGDLAVLKAYALGDMNRGTVDSYEKVLLTEVRSALEIFQGTIHAETSDRLYGWVAQEPCRIVSRPPQWKTPLGEGDDITKVGLIRGSGGELGIHLLDLYAQLLRQEDSALYRPPEILRQKTTAQGVLKPNAFAEIIRKYVRSRNSGAVRYFALDDLDQVLQKQVGEGIVCLASLKQRYHQ